MKLNLVASLDDVQMKLILFVLLSFCLLLILFAEDIAHRLFGSIEYNEGFGTQLSICPGSYSYKILQWHIHQDTHSILQIQIL